MPQLGESVTEGTVTRWLKQVGDHVNADEPLLEVSTDKVDTEIPSPASGTLLEIVAGEDAVVAVGGVLAVIGASDSAPVASTPAAPAPVPSAPTAPAAPAPAAPAPVSSASSGEGTPVTLPALGESVTEGTVTRVLKKVGDHINADEALVEVSTDKVDTEIPSPVSGVILSINVSEDSTIPVGGVIAVVATGAISAPMTPAAPAPTPASTPAPVAAPAAPVTVEAVAKIRIPEELDGYVTPLVRKLAAENGVDLNSLQGTGIGGRIRKQDVLAAAAGTKAAPAVAATPGAP
ncbi:MAG: hypothetical protein RL410_470, partial [Actinomycetota bacterium]